MKLLIQRLPRQLLFPPRLNWRRCQIKLQMQSFQILSHRQPSEIDKEWTHSKLLVSKKPLNLEVETMTEGPPSGPYKLLLLTICWKKFHIEIKIIIQLKVIPTSSISLCLNLAFPMFRDLNTTNHREEGKFRQPIIEMLLHYMKATMKKKYCQGETVPISCQSVTVLWKVLDKGSVEPKVLAMEIQTKFRNKASHCSPKKTVLITLRNKVTTRWEGPQSLSYHKQWLAKMGYCIFKLVQANSHTQQEYKFNVLLMRWDDTSSCFHLRSTDTYLGWL